MNKPAHNVPGDIGGEIHMQFHRIEGIVNTFYEDVKELEELVEEPEENKEEIRVLVVQELYWQLGRLKEGAPFGDILVALSGMTELVDEALSTDPEDANALKVQDILDELELVRGDAVKQVKELGAKLQNPIVWEYPESLGAMYAHRLANGNTLIAESSASRVIEVTPDKEIAWEYTEVMFPMDIQRLANGNTLISDCFGDRVIEVTPAGEIVWEHRAVEGACGVERLEDGNTLIAVFKENRVIEVGAP